MSECPTQQHATASVWEGRGINPMTQLAKATVGFIRFRRTSLAGPSKNASAVADASVGRTRAFWLVILPNKDSDNHASIHN